MRHLTLTSPSQTSLVLDSGSPVLRDEHLPNNGAFPLIPVTSCSLAPIQHGWKEGSGVLRTDNQVTLLCSSLHMGSLCRQAEVWVCGEGLGAFQAGRKCPQRPGGRNRCALWEVQPREDWAGGREFLGGRWKRVGQEWCDRGELGILSWQAHVLGVLLKGMTELLHFPFSACPWIWFKCDWEREGGCWKGPFVEKVPLLSTPLPTELRALPWMICYRNPGSYCQALEIINILTSQNHNPMYTGMSQGGQLDYLSHFPGGCLGPHACCDFCSWWHSCLTMLVSVLRSAVILHSSQETFICFSNTSSWIPCSPQCGYQI